MFSLILICCTFPVKIIQNCPDTCKPDMQNQTQARRPTCARTHKVHESDPRYVLEISCGAVSLLADQVTADCGGNITMKAAKKKSTTKNRGEIGGEKEKRRMRQGGSKTIARTHLPSLVLDSSSPHRRRRQARAAARTGKNHFSLPGLFYVAPTQK